jgi:hypothetical protein
MFLKNKVLSSVADSHHFDAGSDPDSDITYNLASQLQIDADADPDAAYHFDVDPDPDFYLMRIRIHNTGLK